MKEYGSFYCRQEKNAIKAPNEISASARLKFRSINENGTGIQSMTWPRIIRSMRFDNAPPDMTARPVRVDVFTFTKKRIQRRNVHARPESQRVNTGELPNIPKAAPAL